MSEEPSVIRLSDAAALYGRARVRWALDRARWQRPTPGVLVTHNGPLSRIERLRLAVLAGPRQSALAGVTAATLGGLAGFDSDVIHVLVPHKARVPRLPQVIVHRSRLPISGSGDPQRTPFERSLIDAASWASGPSRARALVLAAVQQRLTTPDRLAAALGGPGHRRRSALIRESIADAAGGVESLPEREFGRLLANAGLPTPVRQQVVKTPAGRFRLDAAFDSCGIAVEIDGAHHRDARQSEYDMRRQNELVTAGVRLLRFSSYQVRHEADVVARVIARAMANRPT